MGKSTGGKSPIGQTRHLHPLDARGLERSAAAVEAEAGKFESRYIPMRRDFACLFEAVPVIAGRLGARRNRRHQRRHVAPQVESCRTIPTRPPDPGLRAAHILDNQRDVPPSRLASLALDPEAGVEQRQFLLQPLRIGRGLGGQLPWRASMASRMYEKNWHGGEATIRSAVLNCEP